MLFFNKGDNVLSINQTHLIFGLNITKEIEIINSFLQFVRLPTQDYMLCQEMLVRIQTRACRHQGKCTDHKGLECLLL